MNEFSLFVVSTAHLTNETNAFLASTDCMEWPILGGPYRHVGWFFHADEDFHCHPDEPFQDLSKVVRYACDHGYSNVLFYDLADVIDCLPLYREPEFEEVDAILYAGSSGWNVKPDALPQS